MSYYDGPAGHLKYGVCVSNCQSAPVWFSTTIDSAGDVGRNPSLKLNGAGNPVISYLDATNRNLKLATCTAGCQSIAPTWVITTVDSGGSVGEFSSLQLLGDSPVIAYRNAATATSARHLYRQLPVRGPDVGHRHRGQRRQCRRNDFPAALRKLRGHQLLRR
jgi:hypothetical protein